MKYRDIIKEHYVNVGKSMMPRYAVRVLELLNIAYAPVGGHLNYHTAQDIVDDSDFWKLVRRNGEIIAGCVYKNRQGRKRVAVVHDGSREAKTELKKIIADDITMFRCWSEVSGAFANWCVSQGLPPVPNEHAEQLTGKHIFQLIGRFKYVRLISGRKVVKMIVGYPNGQRYDIGPITVDDIRFEE